MGDVLYPPPFYHNASTDGSYDSNLDPQWSEKANKLYWVGGNTGAYDENHDWSTLHRQRLVSFTNQLGKTSTP
jgi:hypothetical protein